MGDAGPLSSYSGGRPPTMLECGNARRFEATAVWRVVEGFRRISSTLPLNLGNANGDPCLEHRKRASSSDRALVCEGCLAIIGKEVRVIGDLGVWCNLAGTGGDALGPKRSSVRSLASEKEG